jgi:hypothetical protein
VRIAKKGGKTMKRVKREQKSDLVYPYKKERKER